ncbi:MAG: hypothetical protein BVN35_15250 [Proteobacteria bacterium ST_bin11]|nr:MAG: hypothetical protein BVN35_15250 [Proteobacteria bacterium ST_bin11]
MAYPWLSFLGLFKQIPRQPLRTNIPANECWSRAKVVRATGLFALFGCKVGVCSQCLTAGASDFKAI